MQSKAKDVDQYLEEVPHERAKALKRLRQMCRDLLSGYTEDMEYGMPSYSKEGVVEVAFASQKNYISFYVLKEPVMDKHRPSLAGLNLGKGCIRYTNPSKIDFEIVKRLLIDTLHSDAEIC